MNKKRVIPYKDLSDFAEDERIEQIGRKAIAEKLVVGFIVDDEKDKPERYIRKLKKQFPGIRIISTSRGPVENTILVTVGPQLQ